MRKLLIFILLVLPLAVFSQTIPVGFIASQGGAAEYPAEITTNAVVFYDIQAAGTVTKDGSNKVSAWVDAIGGILTLAQATESKQPTWYADSIVFDGLVSPDGDYLVDALAQSQPLTMYLVMRQTTWTSGDVLWHGVNNYMSQRSAAPGIRINAGVSLATSNDYPVNQWKVITIILNGASSEFRINNITSVSGDAGAGAIATLCLGATSAGGSMSNVAYQAVLIHSGADAAETLTAVYNWMAARYTF